MSSYVPLRHAPLGPERLRKSRFPSAKAAFRALVRREKQATGKPFIEWDRERHETKGGWYVMEYDDDGEAVGRVHRSGDKPSKARILVPSQARMVRRPAPNRVRLEP